MFHGISLLLIHKNSTSSWPPGGEAKGTLLRFNAYIFQPGSPQPCFKLRRIYGNESVAPVNESEAPGVDDIHADKDGTGPQNSMNFSKELVLQQRCRNVMKHG